MPSSQVNPTPFVQLILLKMTVDALAEEWEQRRQEPFFAESDDRVRRKNFSEAENSEVNGSESLIASKENGALNYDPTSEVGVFLNRDPIEERERDFGNSDWTLVISYLADFSRQICSVCLIQHLQLKQFRKMPVVAIPGD